MALESSDDLGLPGSAWVPSPEEAFAAQQSCAAPQPAEEEVALESSDDLELPGSAWVISPEEVLADQDVVPVNDLAMPVARVSRDDIKVLCATGSLFADRKTCGRSCCLISGALLTPDMNPRK